MLEFAHPQVTRPAWHGHHGAQLAAPHQVLLWPEVSRVLSEGRPDVKSDLRHLTEGGTPWLVDKTLATITSPGDIPTAVSQDIQSSAEDRDSARTEHRCLWDAASVRKLIRAYHESFNLLRPILEFERFCKLIQDPLLEGRSLEDVDMVLLLLVLALGEISITGLTGTPVRSHAFLPSGFRGGTLERRSGEEYFLEARRRWYLIPSRPLLAHVQANLLFASYHDSNANHSAFWRATADASGLCCVLLQGRNHDWTNYTEEMVSRAYWVCVLNEGYFHMNLDLPSTSILSFRNEVALPFHKGTSVSSQEPVSSASANAMMVSRLVFLASISLHRILDRAQATQHNSKSTIGMT